jgi:flagellar basal body P-ring formation protein FlgA
MAFNRTFRAWSTFTVFLAVLSAQAGPITLRPEASVESIGIFLSEIVSSADDQGFSNIHLSPAPRWGQTVKWSRAEVIDLVAKAAPLVPTQNFTGAESITISRHSRNLDEAELVELLTAALQPGSDPERDGRLSVRLTRWSPVQVPVGKVQLVILDKPATGLAARFSVRFQLKSEEESVGTYSAFLEANLIRDVWVAQSTIRRGTPVDEADLVREPRDIINLRVPAWTEIALDPSFHFVEGVPAGAVVFDRAVRPRPVIKRMQLVRAVVQSGTMSISARVEALEDGAPGDMIRARNPKTRKEFQGRVINEDTIQVDL